MSSEKWQLTLKKVDEMVSQSNASLFDRVTLLCRVWDDPDFLDHHAGDADKAESHLDQKLGDYGIGFFEARAILKEFARKDQWTKGNLRGMLAMALEKEEARRKEQRADAVAVRKGPVPRKEFEQVSQQLEHATERSDSLADENARLRSRITELEKENATLHGRVEQLERMMRQTA